MQGFGALIDRQFREVDCVLDNNWVAISFVVWNEDRFACVLSGAGCRVYRMKVLALNHFLRYSPSETFDLLPDVLKKCFTAPATHSLDDDCA